MSKLLFEILNAPGIASEQELSKAIQDLELLSTLLKQMYKASVMEDFTGIPDSYVKHLQETLKLKRGSNDPKN